jgi:hypothetical protein
MSPPNHFSAIESGATKVEIQGDYSEFARSGSLGKKPSSTRGVFPVPLAISESDPVGDRWGLCGIICTVSGLVNVHYEYERPDYRTASSLE